MLITTQFTTTGSYGSAQKFYANTSDTSPLQLTTTGAVYTEKYIRMYSGSASTNSTLFIQAEQNDAYAQLQLQSGNNIGAPRVILQQYVDYTTSPAFGGCNNKLDMNGNTLTITNGNATNNLPENSITMSYNSSYANNYIQLRVAFDSVTAESSYLTLGYDDFDLFVNGYMVFTIPNTDNQLNMRRIINFGTGPGGTSGTTGILEKSVVNAVTVGSTTLTANANAFTTIINTPSGAGRVFVLPAASAGTIGYWYAFCNKSTTQIITINNSIGVAQITIPAGLAGGAGGYGKVAVDSTGGAYFRCGG